MRIAHIINVTEIDESKTASYLHVAQPVTMRSMVAARDRTAAQADIQLFAVKHHSEHVDLLPQFHWAPDLDTYAWEHIAALLEHDTKRPLPRIADILNALFHASDADWFIYTNLDIGLYPDFYNFVIRQIERGADALCINRRDLEKTFNGHVLGPDSLDTIYSLKGRKHPGSDCFVFRRDIVPLMDFGNVYIGLPPIGRVLRRQVELHSRRFRWIKNAQVTFHLGSDQPWKTRSLYRSENKRQAQGRYIERKAQTSLSKLLRKVSRMTDFSD